MAGRPLHPLEQQRRTVARHLRAEGWTYARIAELLGVARTTAWAIVARAGADPAPSTVAGRNGGRYPSRHRPSTREPDDDVGDGDDCDVCFGIGGEHAGSCVLARQPPRRAPASAPAPAAVNRGGPGRGRTPPDVWPAIAAKVRAGATHAQVAAAFGVTRPRITAIIRKTSAAADPVDQRPAAAHAHVSADRTHPAADTATAGTGAGREGLWTARLASDGNRGQPRGRRTMST